MIEHEHLIKIWIAAENGMELDPIDFMRFSHIWIDFANTQRANLVRAGTVGASGLRPQAVLSIAA